MRDLLVRPPTLQSGADFELLVLASGRRSCIGVDLDSGALVRTHQPRKNDVVLAPFDTARSTLASHQFERAEQPESVEIAKPLQWTGTMSGWRVDRVLRSVTHPEKHHLLGTVGPSVPFWTITGDRPSVSVVPVSSSLSISIDHRGVRCQFSWNANSMNLPLEDPQVLSMLDWLPNSPLSGIRLARAIGFRPARVVVALSKPHQGYCHKVIAGLLPRP